MYKIGGVFIIYYVVILLIVALDQLSKYYVVKNYNELRKRTYDKKFKIILAKNTGAAYSILKNKHKLLVFITIPLILLLIIYLKNIMYDKSMILIKILLSFIIGGGIGNLIDRVRLKYVVDFLYIDIKKFPIFNIADVFILIGVLIASILLLFGYDMVLIFNS